MSQKSNLTGSGLAPQAANFIVGNAAAGLTATGTTITDALPLTDVNEFTTVGSGTGARLPAAQLGDSITVYVATGQSTLSVYPSSATDQINAVTAGSAFSVATNKTAIFTKVSANRWASVLTAQDD